MRKKALTYCHLLLAALLTLICSCSTTRVLEEGEFRLTDNKVIIKNDKHFDTGLVESYIRQKPGSWSPSLWIYNLPRRNDTSKVAKFIRNLGKAPVVFNEGLVGTSVENIGNRLKYLGYYGSRIDTNVHIDNKKASVDYIITLGRQYPIEKINYILPERGEFSQDFLEDTTSITVHPGDFLSEAALEAETVRSASYFRSLGYYGFSKNYFSFEADTLTIPGYAILDMKVNEYTRNETPSEAKELRKYTFANVDIRHPAQFRIRERMLKNFNTIHPGDVYSEEAVNKSYSRLSSVRAFSGVNIELTQNDSSSVNCNITLTPARQQGFKFNLEGSSNSSGLLGISPELSYFHRNIFHGGEMLNLSFMGNFQFKPNQNVRSTEFGVSAGISFPKFIGLPYKYFRGNTIPRTDIKAAYNYQNRPEYTRNIISTSFGYTGSHRNLYYQYQLLQLNVVRLFDVETSFYESLAKNPFMLNSYMDHFDLGTGGNLYYTTNSDVNPKTSYHYVNFQLGLAGNLLSLFKTWMKKDGNGNGMIWNTPYSQYVRSEISAGKTWRFGKEDNQAFATRILVGAGYAYGNSRALPFEQHFYSGGSNSLRGWQARSVGPGLSKPDSTFIIPNQSGDMKLEANMEYRFHAFWKLDGALFVDAGNVWTIQDYSSKEVASLAKFSFSNFPKSIAMDWGLGLRLDLNFILVRIDMGMQLHDPSRNPGNRWLAPARWLKRGNYAINFGVGYPF